MSIKVMTWAWDLPLPGNEKLLLLALADYVNDDGYGAWPSIARLQERTTADRRTVQRNLRKLEERGLVKTDHREGRSNEYVIVPAEVGGGKMPPPPEGRHPRRPGGGTHAAHIRHRTVSRTVRKRLPCSGFASAGPGVVEDGGSSREGLPLAEPARRLQGDLVHGPARVPGGLPGRGDRRSTAADRAERADGHRLAAQAGAGVEPAAPARPPVR